MVLTAHEKQSGSLDTIIKRVLESLVGLRFGSVELIVHDGQVVQIERNEKLRLDASGNHPHHGAR